MRVHPSRSRRIHGSGLPGFGHGLALLLVLASSLAAVAEPAPSGDPGSVEVESALSTGFPIRGQVARPLVELRDRLRALRELDPEAPESDPAPPIDADFNVALDRPSLIAARIPLLEAETERLETRLSELRDAAVALLAPPARETRAADEPRGEGETGSRDEGEPGVDRGEEPVAKPAPSLSPALASEIVTTEVKRDISTARTAYLRGLAARLQTTPDLAKNALIALGAPRASLRTRSADSEATATALRAAGRRLSATASRLEGGGLVGFVVESRELANTAREEAAYLDEAGEALAARAARLGALAETLETEGVRVRTVYLRSAAFDAASRALDRSFEGLLEEQRRLRRSLRDAPGEPGDLLTLRVGAEALVPRPSSLGTTTEAREVIEAAMDLHAKVDAELARDVLGAERWRLAWVNDAVALLSTRISAEERTRAYAVSSELLSDLRSEALVAWQQMSEGWEKTRSAIPPWPEILSVPEGRDLLLRTLGVIVAVVAVIVVRRRTGHAAVTAIRQLARWSPMSPYLGTLVRWTGLLQTLVPVAVLYPVYLVVLRLLRPGSLLADILGAVFLPLFLYALLRQILVGATRQITRGRPALIPLPAATRDRLLVTYQSLGLVFAGAAAIDSLAALAVGEGRIVTLVDGITASWIAIWAAWASLRWREWLAQRWQELATRPGLSAEVAVAGWMARSRIGLLLSPVALARVLASSAASALAGHLSGTTLASRLRAMFLRRLSRRASGSDEAGARAAEIPADYLEEFPLYPLLGEDESVLVPRQELVGAIVSQIVDWHDDGANGSAVLVGEKGSGKTTLAAMVVHRISDTEIVTHTLRGTLLTERDLVRALAEVLGQPDAKTLDQLSEGLRSGPKRLVVLDEAHSVFLRVVGGYRAYDALVSLVNTTTDHVFWLLVFTRYTWSFLNASRSRNHYFRQVIEVPDWTSEEIEDLIRRRTSRAGYELVFSEVLRTDGIGSGGELDLIDGSDAFFRLLWESSAGNPRVATRLWLDSLTPVGERVLEVGLFSEATPAAFSELSDELVFALAAIAQRENLSTEELARTLNMPLGFAQFASRFLSENGLIEPKDQTSDRVTLAPLYYRQVLRMLRNRHLLLE